MYLRIGQAARLLGISPTTLRRWGKEKQIYEDFRTPGRHRRYSYKKILSLMGQKLVEQKPSRIRVVLYARVSAIKQKQDLQRQIKALEQYAKRYNWEIIKIYKDIGSGINDQRKQLHKLVKDLPIIQPDHIICTYKDRLTRFGTGIIEQICKLYGTSILVIHKKEKSEEERLMQDLLAILYSFSGKIYQTTRKIA